MDALELVKKQSREEAKEQLRGLGLTDYGLSHRLLWDSMNRVAKECLEDKKEPGVVAALNNADTDGTLLSVLKEDPEKIMKGISVLAHALGAERKMLYIPEFASNLAKAREIEEMSERYQVEVVLGLVGRNERKYCLCVHMAAAANLVDALEGRRWEGIYVSVNGAELKRVPEDTRIGELADAENAKAILAGYRLYPPEAKALTVEEAGVENGVLRILTSKECIVKETEGLLTKSRRQSCGICVFCREGLLQLSHMQKEIMDGKGKPEFLDMTKEIGEAMEYSSSCFLGQTSARIALSAVEGFKDEYEAHIRKKSCPAGVCFSAETVYINPKLCDGCGECMDICPKDCIEGKEKYIHMIDRLDCDGCGMCVGACPQEAIVKTSGKLPKLPDRLTKAGRFKKWQ